MSYPFSARNSFSLLLILLDSPEGCYTVMHVLLGLYQSEGEPGLGEGGGQLQPRVPAADDHDVDPLQLLWARLTRS